MVCMSGALRRSLHKADTRAQPCTCKGSNSLGWLASILPKCVTESHIGTQTSCLRRAPATYRTKHPEGHNTTQGSTTQRHACGGLPPHTAPSTPRGTTLHKAARHSAMLAAGTSHAPHQAPRGAQHQTRHHVPHKQNTQSNPTLRHKHATKVTQIVRPRGTSAHYQMY